MELMKYKSSAMAGSKAEESFLARSIKKQIAPVKKY